MKKARTDALKKLLHSAAYADQAPSKKRAHEYFKAKINKKKLPDMTIKKDTKDSTYKRLSIEDYEKLYT